MSRRFVTVRIDPSIIADLCSPSFPGTYIRTDYGLPEGAKLIGAGYDCDRMVFFLCFEHPSFPEVPNNEYAPLFDQIGTTAIQIPEKIDSATLAILERATSQQIAAARVAQSTEPQFARDGFRVLPVKPNDGEQPHIVG